MGLFGDRETRRARGRGVLMGSAASSGELIHRVEQLAAEQRRTNELLERIAVATEGRGRPPGGQFGPPPGPRHGG